LGTARESDIQALPFPHEAPMSISRLFASSAACVLLLACTPSPDKVCNHIADILSKDDKDKVSDSDRKKFIDDCVKDGQKQKDKDSDAYGKCAKCMMGVDTLKDLEAKCKSECPKND
jgi:hypothetical protein